MVVGSGTAACGEGRCKSVARNAERATAWRPSRTPVGGSRALKGELPTLLTSTCWRSGWLTLTRACGGLLTDCLPQRAAGQQALVKLPCRTRRLCRLPHLPLQISQFLMVQLRLHPTVTLQLCGFVEARN